MTRLRVRCIIHFVLALVLSYLAQDFYRELGFHGPTADVALLKYVLGIDKTGGPLGGHITAYLDDREGPILISLVLGSAALLFLVLAATNLFRLISAGRAARQPSDESV